jgi:hypothetical protein
VRLHYKDNDSPNYNTKTAAIAAVFLFLALTGLYMKHLLYLSAALLYVSVATAQVHVTSYTAKLEGSVVLKDVEDKFNPQIFNLEMPSPGNNVDKKKLIELKKQQAARYPHQTNKTQYKTTAAAAPVVAIGFVADSFPGVPPDNDMAISKQNKAVSVINSNIAVLDGNTGQMNYRKGLKVYSSVVGLNSITNDYRYDPKIIYDPIEDRFISVMLNGINGSNYIVLGFSKTNDPAAGWNFYKLYGDYKADTTWFDYPTIAITKDELFLSGNKIKYNTSWQAGFTESVIYQVNKRAGYDSASLLNYQIWDGIQLDGKNIRNLYPVKGGDAITGPAQYFLSNRNFDAQNDTILLVKIPDNIASGNKNLSVTVLKAPVSYGVPTDGRQPDTSVTLATNDGRILGAFSAYNSEIQFVSTSINTASGASGIFHGKISNYTTNPAISHAQIISIDTLDFGYPNISFAGNPWGLNQSMISFNYTGPNTYPGMGALLFDGNQYSPMVKVKEGDSSIKVLQGKQQRWGDYTGTQVDWNTPGTVWIEGIYGRHDKRYGNWMAKLNSPLLSVKNQTPGNQAPATMYPNPALQYIFVNFELNNAGNVDFYILGADGRVADKVTTSPCKTGRNTIRFNIASLPAGSYYLKGENAKDGQVFTSRFVKQ